MTPFPRVFSSLDQRISHKWSRIANRPWLLSARIVKWGCLLHIFWRYGYSWESAAGPSMLPTFDLQVPGLLVSNLHRFGKGVEVGDLVTYDIPINNDMGIKRVIGMPGDYVLVHSPGKRGDVLMQVPQGHCWLVGDNLAASRDSRMFGPVPLALVRGKVIAKLTFNHFSIIRNPLKSPCSDDAN